MVGQIIEGIGGLANLANDIGGIASKIATSKNYTDAKNKYTESLGKYTGNAGYANSLAQAAKGAGASSVAAGNRVTQTARGAGMSNAAAALMGGNSVADNYLNDFSNQQTRAYGAGKDYLTGLQNNMDYVLQQGRNRDAITKQVGNTLGNVETFLGTTGITGDIADIIGQQKAKKRMQNLQALSSSPNLFNLPNPYINSPVGQGYNDNGNNYSSRTLNRIAKSINPTGKKSTINVGTDEWPLNLVNFSGPIENTIDYGYESELE